MSWWSPAGDLGRPGQEAGEEGADAEKDIYVKAGFRVYGPLLLLLQPEQLAIITLHSTIRDLMTGETTGLL